MMKTCRGAEYNEDDDDDDDDDDDGDDDDDADDDGGDDDDARLADRQPADRPPTTFAIADLRPGRDTATLPSDVPISQGCPAG